MKNIFKEVKQHYVFYPLLFLAVCVLTLSFLTVGSQNITAQTGASGKVYKSFASAGVEYGGYFSSIDSLNSVTSEEFDASWIKGKTIHTFIALTSPATDDADTCQFIFQGAIRLQNSSAGLDWVGCDTLVVSSKQSQTYTLKVNSFSGRFNTMRIVVTNGGRTKTVPDVNRSGKAIYFGITSDGTNFTGSYNGLWK